MQINSKVTTSQSTLENELVITNTGSVVVTQTTKTQDPVDTLQGIYHRAAIPEDILSGPITVTNKVDSVSDQSKATYGLFEDFAQNAPEITTGRATKITVTRSSSAKALEGTETVVGIKISDSFAGSVCLGDNGSDFTETITVTSTTGSTLNVYGIEAGTTLAMSGTDSDFATTITAKGACKVANGTVSGIQARAISFNGSLTKNITATLNGASGTANAIAVTGSDAAFTVKSIDARLTAMATGNTGDVNAYGINASAGMVHTLDDISKDITAKATATSSSAAKAYGISASGNVMIDGSLMGAVRSTSISKDGNAYVYGITSNGMIRIGEGVKKDVVATVTTGNGSAYAYAIKSGFNSSVTLGEYTATEDRSLTGAITAKATSKSYASAYALYSSKELTVGGDIKKAISATATVSSASSTAADSATAVSANGATHIYGDIKGAITATARHSGTGYVEVYGVQAYDTITVDGNITRVSATGTGGTASVTGISSSSVLTVENSLGTITATATAKNAGSDSSLAFGLSAASIAYTGESDVLKGTIRATLSGKGTGTATGLYCGNITHNGQAGIAQLNVSAVGTSATALDITAACDYTLQKSVLTARSTVRGGYAIAINGTDDAQLLTLDKTTVTGTIDLNSGNDNLSLSNGSAIKGDVLMGAGADSLGIVASSLTGNVNMGANSDSITLYSRGRITGDVDMGDALDALELHSGSLIKGDVKGAESVKLVLDDVKSTAAMWQGKEIGYTNLGIDVDFDDEDFDKIGRTKTFALLKDTDGDTAGLWDVGTKVYLTIDSTTEELEIGGTAKEIGDYTYLVSTKPAGQSTTLQLTISQAAA